MKEWLGSDIHGWGYALTTLTGGHHGLYPQNLGVNTAGDQGLIKRVFNNKFYRFTNSRGSTPYLRYEILDDEEEFFGTPVDIGNIPPINGFCPIGFGDVFQAVAGNFDVDNSAASQAKTYRLLQGAEQLAYLDPSVILTGNNLGAPNRNAIKLSSGTWLVPIHYSLSGNNDTYCGVLRSIDNGATWTRYGAVTKAGSATQNGFSEPAIAEIGNRVLMVMRFEDTAAGTNFWFCWIDDDGRTFGTAIEITTLAAQGRLGGNPPCLLKLRDGRVVLVYSSGNGENYWWVYITSDGTTWTLVAQINSDQTGTVDSKRYVAIVELTEDNCILITANEPDQNTAAQQCIIWIDAVDAVELTPNGAVAHLCPVYVHIDANIVVFSIYVTPTVLGSGADTLVRLADATSEAFGWQIGGAATNNQIFPRIAGVIQSYSNKDLNLNVETKLKIVWNRTTNELDFYMNDYHALHGINTFTGTIDRWNFLVQDGSSTYKIRKQAVLA